MKKHNTKFRNLFSFIVLILISTSLSYSQTYVDVVPGIGTLNNAITANTDSNVIFRLQRGDNAIYLLNGSISSTLPIRIEAAEGTGAKPKLIPVVGSSGSSDVPFRLKSDLFMKNIYVTAMDALGAFLNQIIREDADGIKIYADSCFFENSAQSFIRTNNQLASIRITNSVIRNCLGDYANGRGIDDRGNNMDTLYLENNTFYNISSRVLRDGGGWINYVYVNHNTFVNLGKYIMAIGECPNVVFTNNLAINCGFLGKNKSSTQAQIEVNPLISADFQGKKQTIEAHNNNFAINSALLSHYPDTVVVLPNFNDNMVAVMDSSGFDTTNFTELVQFTTPLSEVDTIITSYWNTGGNDAYSAIGLLVTGEYDFSYPASSVSYTGAVDKLPVGSLMWFKIDTTTEAVNQIPNIPNQYSLYQNYPNPFNPSTVIEYNMPRRADVQIVIYNSLGQAIRTLVKSNQSAGLHSVSWNGTGDAGTKVSSGIYFYRLSAGTFSEIKKMILLK